MDNQTSEQDIEELMWGGPRPEWSLYPFGRDLDWAHQQVHIVHDLMDQRHKQGLPLLPAGEISATRLDALRKARLALENYMRQTWEAALFEDEMLDCALAVSHDIGIKLEGEYDLPLSIQREEYLLLKLANAQTLQARSNSMTPEQRAAETAYIMQILETRAQEEEQA